MNVDDIKELIRILDQSEVSELTWENKDQRLVLKKPAPVPPAPLALPPHPGAPATGVAVAMGTAAAPGDDQGTPGATPVAAAAGPGAAAATGVPGQGASPAPALEDGRLVSVTSPMVGTFYRAPAPDEPPYVQIGDRVEEGQPLCIIEAMKLMNEIESEVSGTVREILVENGQPVEYGQVLFVIEKD